MEMKIIFLHFMALFLLTSRIYRVNSQTEGSNNTSIQDSNHTENGGNMQNLEQTANGGNTQNSSQTENGENNQNSNQTENGGNNQIFNQTENDANARNSNQTENGGNSQTDTTNTSSSQNETEDYFAQYQDLYFNPEFLVFDLIMECELLNMSTEVLMGDTPEKLKVMDALCEGVRVKTCIKQNMTEAKCPPEFPFLKCVYQPKQLMVKYGGMGCYTQCARIPCANLGGNKDETQGQSLNETKGIHNGTMHGNNQTEAALDLEHRETVYRVADYVYMYGYLLNIGYNGTILGNETATGDTGNTSNAQAGGNNNSNSTQTSSNDFLNNTQTGGNENDTRTQTGGNENDTNTQTGGNENSINTQTGGEENDTNAGNAATTQTEGGNGTSSNAS